MSQYNMDQFVIDYFGSDYKGFFVETGSSHPIDQSNTFRLERLGWKGLLVEPRMDHNEDYKSIRPNSIVENYALVSKNFQDKFIKSHVHQSGHMYSIGGISQHDFGATDQFVTWPTTTLSDLLVKHGTTQVDFFSLDVEGYEHEVLEGIDFEKVNFKLMIIEPHPYEWNGRQNDFSYLQDYGYVELKGTPVPHHVWVPKSLS